jgi:hypothetical protein
VAKDQDIESSVRQKIFDSRYNQIGETYAEESSTLQALTDDFLEAFTTISKAPLPQTTTTVRSSNRGRVINKSSQQLTDLPTISSKATTLAYNISHDYNPYYETNRRSRKFRPFYANVTV